MQGNEELTVENISLSFPRQGVQISGQLALSVWPVSPGGGTRHGAGGWDRDSG